MVEEEIVDNPRPYKEFPYFNSNNEQFGVTLKGKTKAYINAHIIIKELIVKGKELVTPLGTIKFLDTSSNNARINTVVVSNENNKGNAEIIAYDPSRKRTKGATGWSLVVDT